MSEDFGGDVNGAKGPPQACLFVTNFSKHETEETLGTLFGGCGTVANIKLLTDKSLKPYAFIQYENVHAANRGLCTFNGFKLSNCILRVQRAKVNTTIFLAKLGAFMTEEELKLKLDAPDDSIEIVRLLRNRRTGLQRGCAFVKFKFREDAVDAMNRIKSRQPRWVVEWSNNTESDNEVDMCSVFVGGLNPLEASEDKIRQQFCSYGVIESIDLINGTYDQTGSTKSAIAFVKYMNQHSAALCIESENGNVWLGRKIRVQYCETQEMKKKRKQQPPSKNNPNIETPFQSHGMRNMDKTSMDTVNYPRYELNRAGSSSGMDQRSFDMDERNQYDRLPLKSTQENYNNNSHHFRPPVHSPPVMRVDRTSSVPHAFGILNNPVRRQSANEIEYYMQAEQYKRQVLQQEALNRREEESSSVNNPSRPVTMSYPMQSHDISMIPGPPRSYANRHENQRDSISTVITSTESTYTGGSASTYDLMSGPFRMMDLEDPIDDDHAEKSRYDPWQSNRDRSRIGPPPQNDGC